ncbi:hypothetical protein GM71_21890 [Salmonella enterica subsp. enterica serovar Oranienburg]|nr:hypothetical protein [Salmonella enterica]EBV6530931.1 hypothetical protein [Salmonella enterica subsp. enterica serovar Oranienburg]
MPLCPVINRTGQRRALIALEYLFFDGDIILGGDGTVNTASAIRNFRKFWLSTTSVPMTQPFIAGFNAMLL